MEGRVSREELIGAKPRVSPTEYSPPLRSARYVKSSSGGARRTYRRGGSYGSRGGIIPEGGDLLIVQLMVCGLLLLFVLFVSVVDTEGTAAVSGGLREAFSRSTTFEEVKHGLASVTDKLTSGAGTVFEIFGGETPEADAITEANGQSAPQAEKTSANEAAGNPGAELRNPSEATVDSNALKELYDSYDGPYYDSGTPSKN